MMALDSNGSTELLTDEAISRVMRPYLESLLGELNNRWHIRLESELKKQREEFDNKLYDARWQEFLRACATRSRAVEEAVRRAEKAEARVGELERELASLKERAARGIVGVTKETLGRDVVMKAIREVDEGDGEVLAALPKIQRRVSRPSTSHTGEAPEGTGEVPRQPSSPRSSKRLKHSNSYPRGFSLTPPLAPKSNSSSPPSNYSSNGNSNSNSKLSSPRSRAHSHAPSYSASSPHSYVASPESRSHPRSHSSSSHSHSQSQSNSHSITPTPHAYAPHVLSSSESAETPRPVSFPTFASATSTFTFPRTSSGFLPPSHTRRTKGQSRHKTTLSESTNTTTHSTSTTTGTTSTMDTTGTGTGTGTASTSFASGSGLHDPGSEEPYPFPCQEQRSRHSPSSHVHSRLQSESETALRDVLTKLSKYKSQRPMSMSSVGSFGSGSVWGPGSATGTIGRAVKGVMPTAGMGTIGRAAGKEKGRGKEKNEGEKKEKGKEREVEKGKGKKENGN